MAYRIRLTEAFQSEFDAAFDYNARILKNPAAARSLASAFHETMETVAFFPRAYRPRRVRDGSAYHAAPVRNYLAFYVILGDTIEFRRFLYARSDIGGRL